MTHRRPEDGQTKRATSGGFVRSDVLSTRLASFSNVSG